MRAGHYPREGEMGRYADQISGELGEAARFPAAGKIAIYKRSRR